MAKLLNENYQAGLHLYKYLLNTYKYWIVYDGLSNKSIIIHSNSEWAQDSESHKSLTSYFILISHRVTSWISCQ